MSDTKGLRPIFLIFIGAIAAILPILIYGVPFSRDLYHHFRLAIAFFDAFRAGDFYPGWLAHANSGFGELSPRFYPPGLSYLLVLGRLLLGSWYVSAVLVFLALTFIGGIGVYLWARCFMLPRAAAWAGVLYMFTPYHLNELYQSSLLAEYAAAAVLPFVFAFTERICRNGGRRDMAGLAASYAALVLTHTPLSVIGSYVLIPYTLLSLAASDRQRIRQTTSRLACGVGLALAASACFWVTVAAELQWLRPDIEPENFFSSQLFLFSTFRQTANTVWYGNLIALATLILAVPALVLWRSRTLLFIFVGSLLMSTVITYPLWLVLPLLKTVQAPWRWLAVASMAVSVLAGGSILKLTDAMRDRRRPLALIGWGCIAGAVVFSIAHPVREARYISRAQFDSVLENLDLPSIGAWYPRWVKEQFLDTRHPVMAEGRSIAVTSWDSERRRFQVSSGQPVNARIRTFYYPLWSASVNGQSLDVRPSEDGAMLIALPKEDLTIDLVFREPARSMIAVVVSLAGWVVIVCMFFVRSRIEV